MTKERRVRKPKDRELKTIREEIKEL